MHYIKCSQWRKRVDTQKCNKQYAEIIREFWEQEPSKRLNLEVIQQKLKSCLSEQIIQAIQKPKAPKGENSILQMISKVDETNQFEQNNTKVIEVNEEVQQTLFATVLDSYSIQLIRSQIKNVQMTVENVRQSILNKPCLDIQTDFISKMKALKDSKLNKSYQSNEIEVAAANAITILNYIGYKFIKKDLRGIKIQGADFVNRILRDAILSESNLQELILEMLRLIIANLTIQI